MKKRLFLFIFIILNFVGHLYANDITFINYGSELHLKRLNNSLAFFNKKNKLTINNPSFTDYDKFGEIYYSQVRHVTFMYPYTPDEELHFLFDSLKDIINFARSHEIIIKEKYRYDFLDRESQKSFFDKARQYYGEGSPEFLFLIVNGVYEYGRTLVMDQLTAHNADSQYWKMFSLKFPYGWSDEDEYLHSWEYVKAKSQGVDNGLIEVNQFDHDWSWKKKSDYTEYLNVISDKIVSNSYSKEARAEFIKLFLDKLETYCLLWDGLSKAQQNTGHNMSNSINAVINNILTIDGPQSADLLTIAKHLRWLSWITSDPHPDIDKYCSRVFSDKDFVILSKTIIDAQGSKLKFEDLDHLTTATLKSYDSMTENGVQWDYSLFSPTDLLKLNKKRITDEYGKDSAEFLIFKNQVITRYGERSDEYRLIMK